MISGFNLFEKNQSGQLADGPGRLLDRCDGVRRSGSRQWVARCPAHDDRSPSLAVRELDDGRVLIHCFGGCSPLDVLSSVGLDFSALFPSSMDHGHRAPIRRPFSASTLLHLIDREALIIVIAAADLIVDGRLKPEHLARVIAARHRIAAFVRGAQ